MPTPASRRFYILMICRHLANLTPLYALSLAATVATRHSHVLRAFLERHLVSRAYFGVSAVSSSIAYIDPWLM